MSPISGRRRDMKRYAIGTLFVVALAFVSSASAGKPDVVRINVDDFIPGAYDCGSYQLDEHVFGPVILRDFFQNGELVMSLNNFGLKHIISNPTTGASLTTPDVGADHFMVAKDGTATIMIVGIVARVVVPGQGIVAGEIGKLTLFFAFPGAEPVVSFAGIHDGFDAVVAAYCATLAP
jgi:hypothetical protein